MLHNSDPNKEGVVLRNSFQFLQSMMYQPLPGKYIIMIENIKNVQGLKEKCSLWVMISKRVTELEEPSAPAPVDTDVKHCLQG